MTYITTIAYIIVSVLLYKDFEKRRTNNQIKPWVIPSYIVILLVTAIGSNYINNKFLAEHKAKPYVKELQTKVYQEPLNNLQLKPVMSTEERQERTDIITDRKQITEKLYDK